MEKLHINPTQFSPEIILDPAEWRISIRGISAPEDVRGIYYPVIEWVTEMTNTIIGNPGITGVSGVTAEFDLQYFNSSSGKFLYDIFGELARLKGSKCSIEVRWYHDSEDSELLEAGKDMAEHSGIDMIFIPK